MLWQDTQPYSKSVCPAATSPFSDWVPNLTSVLAAAGAAVDSGAGGLADAELVGTALAGAVVVGVSAEVEVDVGVGVAAGAAGLAVDVAADVAAAAGLFQFIPTRKMMSATALTKSMASRMGLMAGLLGKKKVTSRLTPAGQVSSCNG